MLWTRKCWTGQFVGENKFNILKDERSKLYYENLVQCCCGLETAELTDLSCGDKLTYDNRAKITLWGTNIVIKIPNPNKSVTTWSPHGNDVISQENKTYPVGGPHINKIKQVTVEIADWNRHYQKWQGMTIFPHKHKSSHFWWWRSLCSFWFCRLLEIAICKLIYVAFLQIHYW